MSETSGSTSKYLPVWMLLALGLAGAVAWWQWREGVPGPEAAVGETAEAAPEGQEGSENAEEINVAAVSPDPVSPTEEDRPAAENQTADAEPPTVEPSEPAETDMAVEPGPVQESDEVALAPLPTEGESAEDGTPPDETAGFEVPSDPEAAPPAFDLVRIAPDGETLIAGKAAPGADVSVLIDGEIVAEAQADRQGNFVSLLSIGASEEARVVTLETGEDSAAVASEQEIIVAPMPASADASDTAMAATDMGDPLVEDDKRDVAETAEAVAASPEAGDEGEPEAPTLLLSDGSGVRVIQGATPKVQDSVAIDAITYDVEGEVTLTGRAGNDGFVRVYLDNRPILETEIGEDGNWRTPLPEIDTGVYTLRVDALDAEGKVTARAETPFLREPVEAVQTFADELRSDAAPELVTVQPGDHLWGIATRRYGDGMLFVRVFQANQDQIRNPDLIYPGQIFSLPQ